RLGSAARRGAPRNGTARRQRRTMGRPTHHSSGPFRDKQHTPRRRGKCAGIPAATEGKAGLHGPGYLWPTLNLVGVGVNRIGKLHSLRALAIREHKIHAVGIPDLKFKGTPVFLDVEGVPDRDFYYLIGIRIQAAEGSIQQSFWADDAKEEKLIWNDFLGVLSEIKDPHLIHYGSYETTFLKRMCERHGPPPAGSQVATAVDHATNLLSFIYAQIYF